VPEQTIEYAYANPRAGTREGGYNVYEHGVYPSSSVLAGQPSRTYKGHFNTIEEAQTAFPEARPIEGSTKRYGNPLPSTPPSWFDPANAGEAWHEDDY